MKVLRRWFLKQLSRRARPYLQSYGLLKTGKTFHQSALVWEPEGDRILVLAPHMDDEVIGCGGTLYKHIRRGAEVTVIYMTDGRFGSKTVQDVTGEERKRREEALVQTRKEEAQRAMKILGVKEGIFLDAQDSTLVSTREMQDRLNHILESVRPDVVYLPFFLEEHPDHRAASQFLVQATEGTRLRFNCCGYEVWTPLFPNCFVDINDAIEIKKQALQQYRSQLADKNYIHTSVGLNAYRSSALLDENCRFVEAFFMVSLHEYRKLYKSYCDFGATSP